MLVARSAVLLLVALQLQPLVLPALCDRMRAERSMGCAAEALASETGVAVAQQEDHDLCLSSALCGVTPAAVVVTPAGGILSLDARAQVPLPLGDSPGADRSPPLVPPPIA